MRICEKHALHACMHKHVLTQIHLARRHSEMQRSEIEMALKEMDRKLQNSIYFLN